MRGCEVFIKVSGAPEVTNEGVTEAGIPVIGGEQSLPASPALTRERGRDFSGGEEGVEEFFGEGRKELNFGSKIERTGEG